MKLTYNGLQTLETIKGTRYAIAKLAPAGDILKRDVSDITTVGTSLFAGGALVKGAHGIAKAVSIGTLFFNATNTAVLTPEVKNWLKNETTHGKKFLKWYRIANLFNDLASIYSSGYKVDNVFNFMSSYFSAGGVYEEFGKEFENKFPEEFKIMVEEMNKLK